VDADGSLPLSADFHVGDASETPTPFSTTHILPTNIFAEVTTRFKIKYYLN